MLAPWQGAVARGLIGLAIAAYFVDGFAPPGGAPGIARAGGARAGRAAAGLGALRCANPGAGDARALPRAQSASRRQVGAQASRGQGQAEPGSCVC